jgi:hypothetical protein
LSSRDSRSVDFLAALRDQREDLSGKVTLQSSNGIELGMPFGESASDVVLGPLVGWLFFAIGLYAESNSVVIAAITFGALSIAFAIFLILELGMPYTGLFRVSPAALVQTIEFMGK